MNCERSLLECIEDADQCGFGSYSGDSPVLCLKCPVCGFSYQHPTEPRVVRGEESHEFGNVRFDGGYIVVPIWGECGCEWEIYIGCSRGAGFVFCRVVFSCKSESYVYFIEGIGLQRIKIGKARDPKQRLKQMQTSSPVPLRLLGTVAGTTHLEKRLHKEFASLRTEGEWFRATKELRDYIAEVTHDATWPTEHDDLRDEKP